MKLEMIVAKATTRDGSRKFVSSASDTGTDLERQKLTMSCFKSFIDNMHVRGMPYLGVAHYPFSSIGVHTRAFIDGEVFKLEGEIAENNPLADAAYEALRKDRTTGVRRIRTSVGFYPNKAHMEKSGVLAYDAGWMEHNALTTAPANPRTDIMLVEKGHGLPRARTMYEDALFIVGKDHADLLEKTYRERKARRVQGYVYLPGGIGPGQKTAWLVEELKSAIGDDLPDVPLVLPTDDAEHLSVREVADAGAAVVVPPSTWQGAGDVFMDLSDPRMLDVFRNVLMYYAINKVDIGGLDKAENGDLIDVLSKADTKNAYYNSRLVELMAPHIHPALMDEYHLAARGHAGGKTSPIKHKPTAAERVMMARLAKEDLDDFSDAELEYAHSLLHKAVAE